jgi:hypothetical protein
MLRAAWATALLTALLVCLLPAGTAFAGQIIVCQPDGSCTVEVSSPGGGGGGTHHGGGGGGGAAVCFDQEENMTVPCQTGEGWWDPDNGCWAKLMDPQPLPSDPLWKFVPPDEVGKGQWYMFTCVESSEGQYPGYELTPPTGYGGLTDPIVLAAQAISMLHLGAPEIGMAPTPGSKGGLVGLPVWMWTTKDDNTWGPKSATASIPGESVTATATVENIVWDMGDGNSVTCTTPGTPYSTAYGADPSPDCGYRYATTGTFTVTATTTWDVNWSGGGKQGEITVTRPASVQVTIGELQSVNSN